MKKLKGFKKFFESQDEEDLTDFQDRIVDEPESFEEEEPASDDEQPVELDPISFEDAKNWILENYDEEKVLTMLEEERLNWIDYEQMEAEGYESEYDYYVDYGRGEAESAVVEMIVDDLESNYQLDFNKYADETDIYSFIRTISDCLQW